MQPLAVCTPAPQSSIPSVTPGEPEARAYRELSAKLNLVSLACNVGLWDYDCTTREFEWDQRCKAILGQAKELPLHYPAFLRQISGIDRKQISRTIRELTQSKADHLAVVQFRLIRPTGERAWVRATSQVQFQDLAGAVGPAKYFGTLEEITECIVTETNLNKTIEEHRLVLDSTTTVAIGGQRVIQAIFRDRREHLRLQQLHSETETRFRALFEQAAVGVAQIAGADLRFQQVNRKYCELLGRTAEEMTALTLEEITHPEGFARCREALQRLREGWTRDFHLEIQQFTKESGLLWIRITLAPLAGEGIHPNSYVAIIQEIDHRKKAEQQLEEAWCELERSVETRTLALIEANRKLQREIAGREIAQKALREAEFCYRTVADFTHDWEYWLTPEQKLLYCSPSCQRITGYFAQEFTADPGLLTKIVHPEDRDLWKAHLRESPHLQAHPLIEFRIVRKDGGVRWIEHVGQPVLLEDREFRGIRGSNRDITRRKEMEWEGERLRRQLSKVSRMTTAGHFAVSLAHELNQPLATIHCNARAALEFLAPEKTDLDEVREALGEIQADSKRASQIVQNLRAMLGRVDLERELVDLNVITLETLALFHNPLLLHRVVLGLDLDSTLPKVVASKTAIQQVVLNLLSNAVEAMASSEGGKRELRISSGHGRPGFVCLHVRDSGPGLADSQLRAPFQPFFTTKPDGMGMGLVISRSILEAHGGQLRLGNHPEGGAEFSLELPLPDTKPGP